MPYSGGDLVQSFANVLGEGIVLQTGGEILMCDLKTLLSLSSLSDLVTSTGYRQIGKSRCLPSVCLSVCLSLCVSRRSRNSPSGNFIPGIALSARKSFWWGPQPAIGRLRLRLRSGSGSGLDVWFYFHGISFWRDFVVTGLMLNTHRRRDATVELSRVGVGGVYWA